MYYMYIYSNGNTGVSRALMDTLHSSFYLYAVVDHTRMVDDGLLNGAYRSTLSRSPEDMLLGCSSQFIFFYENLNDRLQEIYNKSRTRRKPVWLVDIAVQDYKEIVKIIYNQEYIKRTWNRDMAFHGFTETESPGIYHLSRDFFSKLSSELIAHDKKINFNQKYRFGF